LQELGDVAAISAVESKLDAVAAYPLPDPRALPASPSIQKKSHLFTGPTPKLSSHLLAAGTYRATTAVLFVPCCIMIM